MVTWLRPFAGAVFIGAIALRVSERRLIEALEAAGATDPERAIPLSLSNPLRRWQFQRLLAAGAIGETMEMRQYLRVAEYAAFRGRRRTRALIVLAIVAVLAFAFWSIGCASRDAAATSTVRDSAGVEIIEHPAEVIAAVPEWTIDTGVHRWTVGGGGDPATEIMGAYCAVRLADGRILICHSRPNEIRVYDTATGTLQRFGRNGSGPGEYQAFWPIGIRGDTLLLWDRILTRLTRVTTAGEVIDVRSFATLPRDVTRGIAGFVSPDRLLSMAPTFGNLPPGPPGSAGQPASPPDGARREMPVFLVHADASGADSLPGHPYIREYAGTFMEGGQRYESRLGYELDGPSIFQVFEGHFAVVEPDAPEVIVRAADGRVTRIIRLAIPRRAVTPDLRARYIAAESTNMIGQQPQFIEGMMENYRTARFVDSLAPFERMLRGPNDELWLEATWLQFDATKHYVVVDSAGQVTGRVTIPMDHVLWWVGADAALMSWHDADDVRHFSLHPFVRHVTR